MPFSEFAVEVLPETGVSANASADDLYRVGLAYSTGVGVEADYIAAHKWFNLAAMKGSSEAKDYRREMADMMSSEDLKAALSAARDWLNLAN